MDNAQSENKTETVEDQLAMMRAGTKEIWEIRMRDRTFPVRVLSVEEVQMVRRAAIQQMRKDGGDDTDQNVLVQKMTLKLASTVTPGGFPSINDAILKRVTMDELLYLFNEYLRVMDSVNPSLETIEPEKFRALVEALKKNNVSSKDLSLLQLRAICSAFQGLIQKLETAESQADNSSGGQPAA